MSHKPVTINIAGPGLEQQESARVTRKSLKTLQHTATDKENLTGRPPKNLKDLVSKGRNWEALESKRKKLSKETQASGENTVTEEDLTSEAGPSENYWKLLAEKRQVALGEALEENEKLWKLIEELKEENILVKQMLEEANSFVEVFKEMVEDNNDTGIDVKDISASDTSAIDVSSANVSTADTSTADISTADISTANLTANNASSADINTTTSTVGHGPGDPDDSAGPSVKRAKEE